MNGARAVLWIVGVALVLAAAFIFFFATGLAQWVPFSIAAAAVILFIGIAVMSFAEKSHTNETHVEEHHHDHH